MAISGRISGISMDKNMPKELYSSLLLAGTISSCNDPLDPARPCSRRRCQRYCQKWNSKSRSNSPRYILSHDSSPKICHLSGRGHSASSIIPQVKRVSSVEVVTPSLERYPSRTNESSSSMSSSSSPKASSRHFANRSKMARSRSIASISPVDILHDSPWYER